MECVRDAIAGSQSFMNSTSFDPCVNICSAEQSAFERRYMELFTAHLARKKESSYQQLRDANRHGQETRSASDVESPAAMCAGSASSSGGFFCYGRHRSQRWQLVIQLRTLRAMSTRAKIKKLFKFSVIVGTEEAWEGCGAVE